MLLTSAPFSLISSNVSQEEKEDALFEMKRSKDQDLEIVLAEKQSMAIRGEKEREEGGRAGQGEEVSGGGGWEGTRARGGRRRMRRGESRTMAAAAADAQGHPP